AQARRRRGRGHGRLLRDALGAGLPAAPVLEAGMSLRVIRDARPGAPDAVVAIGSFDGVHLGHRALLAKVVREAAERGLAPAVLTFEPLPRELLFPDRAPPRLSTLSAKLHAFAEAGIAIAYVCRFD